jgi:hypothetical protein
MSKHTKGQWRVFDNRDDDSFDAYDAARIGVSSGLDPDDVDVAHCYGFESEINDEEVLANALLISTAPDMLAALETIAFKPIGHADASHKEVLDAVVEIARAVIAKATGGAEWAK